MLFNNRYQLKERVASGGMGEVWRGTDVLLHRGVAVKVLLPTLMSDSEFITRFRTEARMMASVRHPGIVQVYDYGEDAVVEGVRMDYLVMEYVEGTPLSRRIEAAGKLGVAETMGIVGQAADALQVAHEAGIVHRDVKPSNLLVKPGGAVVLVDFGVARSVGVTGITSTNVVLGSVHYMAPEQAEGKPVSPVTDVYALGAVAYNCLTGRPPYEGDNPLQVLGQLVLGEPPTLPLEIPAPASTLVLRALEKDPARRFPSAAALADAARSAQNTLAMPAMPGSVMPGSAMRRFRGVWFGDARLCGVWFCDARLCGVWFCDARFRGFRDARLRRVRFRGVWFCDGRLCDGWSAPHGFAARDEPWHALRQAGRQPSPQHHAGPDRGGRGYRGGRRRRRAHLSAGGKRSPDPTAARWRRRAGARCRAG